MAANASDNDVDLPSDNDFELFLSPRQRRREDRKRKVREGSLPVENLTGDLSSSDSDGPDNMFQTPKQALPKALQYDPQVELKLLIMPIDKTKNLKKVSPLTIAKVVKAKCGTDSVQSIKQISSGILIVCRNIKQQRMLKEIEVIGNIPVRVTDPPQGVKGIIFDVPLEMTQEEILQELKSQGVLTVTRMTKRAQASDIIEGQSSANPQRIELKSVILTFKTQLPQQIHLCFQIFKVKQYIPNPIRCFKCQRFGHPAQQCRYKERCVRCGGPHNFETCPQKESPKCVNCGGLHSAAYGGCTSAKTAQAIQKVKIENKVSYAHAAKLYTQKSEGENTQSRVVPPPALSHQSGENIPHKSDQLNAKSKGDGQNVPSTSGARTQVDSKVAPIPPPPLRNGNIESVKPKQQQVGSGNKTLPQEGHNLDKRPDKIEKGEQIITLLISLISVVFNDNNQIDELYNINLIRVAAERLLQIKENEFVCNETY